MRDKTTADRLKSSLPVRNALEAMSLAVLAEAIETERMTIAIVKGVWVLRVSNLN